MVRGDLRGASTLEGKSAMLLRWVLVDVVVSLVIELLRVQLEGKEVRRWRTERIHRFEAGCELGRKAGGTGLDQLFPREASQNDKVLQGERQ